MKKCKFISFNHAQTAVEYLLILAVVAAVVLAAFKFLLPQVRTSSEGYYNNVTDVVLGNGKVEKIDGGWCPVECPPAGTGNPMRYRICECPAPAFGGLYCTDPNNSVTHGGSEVVNCLNVKMPTSSCTPDGTCSAPTPSCGQVTMGENNCHQVCTRQGPPCPR